MTHFVYLLKNMILVSIKNCYLQSKLILFYCVRKYAKNRPANSGKTAHPSRRDGMLFRSKRHDAV